MENYLYNDGTLLIYIFVLDGVWLFLKSIWQE